MHTYDHTHTQNQPLTTKVSDNGIGYNLFEHHELVLLLYPLDHLDLSCDIGRVRAETCSFHHAIGMARRGKQERKICKFKTRKWIVNKISSSKFYLGLLFFTKLISIHFNCIWS